MTANGTTTVLIDEAAEVLAAHTEPAVLDFDTKLQLRSIAMDVSLNVPQEAHDAAADAIAEASGYATTPETHEAVTHPLSREAERVLKYAATIIRVRGWTQGEWVSDCGAVCAMTAVRIAAGGDSESFNEAEDELLRRVGSEDPGLMMVSVPSWNDASGRTREDVLRLLEGR